MTIIAVIWIVTAIVLWAHYKVVTKVDMGVDAPPQSTLVGSLMWPFYLIGYLYERSKRLFSKVDQPDQ